MLRNISIGIDLGSAMTRVVVGEFVKGEKNPKVIGSGEVETRGMRHGYVINYDDAVESVRKAVDMAEKSSGIKIKRAFISAGGISLRGNTSLGSTIVSKADGEVTNLDVNKALADSEQNLNLTNKKVIHVSPISYRLDGQEVQGRLEGMHGNKLEAKSLVVTYSVQHVEDMIEVMAGAGVETIDVIPTPLADSYVALSDKQKIVGSAVVNIGAETVSMAVFENGLLMSMHSYSIGGADITNDIALGLKIPLEKAEALKLGNDETEYSKKKLAEIIEARIGDIFELIENHLKKIKRAELLPAGVIFVGGGSNIAGLEEFSRDTLRLPSTIRANDMFGNTKTKLRDPSWTTALGLLISSKENEQYAEGSFWNMFKGMETSIKSSLKQLMP